MTNANGDQNTPCIWIVQGHFDPRNARGWLPFEAPSDTERCPDEIIEAARLNKSGNFLSPSRFPTDNYPRSNDNEGAHRERFPQIFSNGFFFLRKESADLLSQFDLGEGALYPTRLWHPDRKTPVPGEYFYLSQGNRKDAFLLEQSPMAQRVSGGGDGGCHPTPRMISLSSPERLSRVRISGGMRKYTRISSSAIGWRRH